MALDPGVVLAAADSISMQDRWYYTTRNLFYELVRCGDLPEPVGDGSGDFATFEGSLAQFESIHGRLSRLVRKAAPSEESSVDALSSDLLTYAVRRVVMFERPELMLLFALNHFFLKLECILLAGDGTPNHVQERVRSQLEVGLPMDFFVVHDATPEGYAFFERVLEAHAGQDHLTVQRIGITLTQVGSRLDVRETGPVRSHLDLKHAPEGDALRLAQGHFVHLEEVDPLHLMRLVYNRTVGRFDEVGFG
jgi:hypothetical protein